VQAGFASIPGVADHEAAAAEVERSVQEVRAAGRLRGLGALSACDRVEDKDVGTSYGDRLARSERKIRLLERQVGHQTEVISTLRDLVLDYEGGQAELLARVAALERRG
jgi:hypothetical protein